MAWNRSRGRRDHGRTCQLRDRPPVRGRLARTRYLRRAATRHRALGCRPGNARPADAAALIISNIDPGGPNVVDEPVRLALLPEHWTGWVGRPGLSGSRAGRAWSPKFTATEVRLDGKPVDRDGWSSNRDQRRARLRWRSTRSTRLLSSGCHITIELTVGWTDQGTCRS